ncbi:MAG: hypothetical protein AAGJ79_06675 [Verrucomicrobiota bacterium]
MIRFSISVAAMVSFAGETCADEIIVDEVSARDGNSHSRLVFSGAPNSPIEALARSGNSQALYAFANWHGIGERGKKPDANELRLKYLFDAAAAGNPDAFKALAQLLTDGDLIERDLEKAFDYWLKLADVGFTDADIKIAECYENGTGTEVDLEKAEIRKADFKKNLGLDYQSHLNDRIFAALSRQDVDVNGKGQIAFTIGGRGGKVVIENVRFKENHTFSPERLVKYSELLQNLEVLAPPGVLGDSLQVEVSMPPTRELPDFRHMEERLQIDLASKVSKAGFVVEEVFTTSRDGATRLVIYKNEGENGDGAKQEAAVESGSRDGMYLFQMRFRNPGMNTQFDLHGGRGHFMLVHTHYNLPMSKERINLLNGISAQREDPKHHYVYKLNDGFLSVWHLINLDRFSWDLYLKNYQPIDEKLISFIFQKYYRLEKMGRTNAKESEDSASDQN